jgi:hypothetical protein
MAAVIGDLLALAIGIAISPIPIIAVILMLLSRKATATSTGFLLGWVVGIVLVTVVVLVLVGQAGNTAGGEPSTLSSVLKLVLGVALILLAVRQWQGRPKAGETGATPKWMDAIESFSFVRALLLGFGLSAINPKNRCSAWPPAPRSAPRTCRPGRSSWRWWCSPCSPAAPSRSRWSATWLPGTGWPRRWTGCGRG